MAERALLPPVRPEFEARQLDSGQIGAVLRYQSGALLSVPYSLNGIETQLDRSGGSGAFNGGTNLWNAGADNHVSAEVEIRELLGLARPIP